jgi:biotin carboxyl carrier protein
MQYRYNIEGKEHTVAIEGSGEGMVATVGDRTLDIRAVPAGGGCLVLEVNGRSYPVHFARDENGLHIAVAGWSVIASEPGREGVGLAGEMADVVEGKQILVAPMPGQVVKVNVKVGDAVKKKQCLVIVEAMKMENELNTAIDGTVTAVHVEPGQQVDALEPLVEVEQEES